MAKLALAPTLAVSTWTKQVGDAEKPAKMAAQLSELKKRFDALPSELLELGKVTTQPAAEQRVRDIASKFDKAAKALEDQAASVASLAKDCESRFKKDPKAKPAVAAAAAVLKEAQGLAKAVTEASDAAQEELEQLLDKFEAEAKKQGGKKEADKDDDDAEDMAREKDEKAFKNKLKAQIKSCLKKVKSDGAAPAKFRAVVLGKNWGIFVGNANSEGQKKLAVRMLGASSGFRDCKGLLYWSPADKLYVLEGATVPTGAANANALALSLKGLIGFRPKLRLQRPGQKGEDSEGAEDDPEDEPIKAKPGGKDPAVEAAKAFTARLQALKPRIDEGLKAGGDLAKKLKDALADVGKLAQRKQMQLADKMLDQAEELLKKIRDAAQHGGDAAQADMAALAQVRQAWGSTRQAAIKGLEDLAKTIETEYAQEKEQLAQAKQAASRLRGLAKGLTNDLERLLEAAAKEKNDAQRQRILRGAKASITGLRKVVDGDPLMKEIDGNELMPSLRIVKPMQDRLSEVADALA